MLCGNGALATTAGAGVGGTVVAETSPELPDCAPTFPAEAGLPEVPAVESGMVVVVGLEGGPTGPVELAENTDWAMGPAPILSPATTDSAAAMLAPAATRRFRTKYNFDAVIASGTTAWSGLGKRMSERTRGEDFFQRRVIVRVSPFGLRPPHDPPLQSSVRQGSAARSFAPRFRRPLTFNHIAGASV